MNKIARKSLLKDRNNAIKGVESDYMDGKDYSEVIGEAEMVSATDFARWIFSGETQNGFIAKVGKLSPRRINNYFLRLRHWRNKSYNDYPEIRLGMRGKQDRKGFVWSGAEFGLCREFCVAFDRWAKKKGIENTPWSHRKENKTIEKVFLTNANGVAFEPEENKEMLPEAEGLPVVEPEIEQTFDDGDTVKLVEEN